MSWYELAYGLLFSLGNRSWKLFHIRTYIATLFFQFSAEYFML